MTEAVPPKTGVGKGQPPKDSQWKKGQSGNPGGRPKGTPNLKTVVIKLAKTRVKMTVNGVTKTKSALEAQVETTQLRGLKGDARSAEKMLDLYDEHLPASEEPGPRVLSEEARKLLTNHAALMKLIEEAGVPNKPKDEKGTPN